MNPMLNFVSIDREDGLLLARSYDALLNKENIQILTKTQEKEKLLIQTINALKIPFAASFSFQNLFKLKCEYGSFYIAQCLIDFGYPVTRGGMQYSDQRYRYSMIGMANISVDLGITNMRTETLADRIINRFFNGDINFPGSEKFSDKYYLASTNRDAVELYFTKDFLNTLGKYNDLMLTSKGSELYISFDGGLAEDQSRQIQEILSSFRYLKR